MEQPASSTCGTTTTTTADGKCRPRIPLILITIFVLFLLALYLVRKEALYFSANTIVAATGSRAPSLSLATLPNDDDDAAASSELPPPPPAFNTSLLNGVRCIPEICKLKERFIHSPNFTLLASYPGSGNTWTRTVIEAGSKAWTGTVYKDLGLLHNGFKGEAIDPFGSGSVSRVSAIKTHYPYYLSTGVGGKVTGAVVVMRSPFDAILAEFTRRFGSGSEHTSKVTAQVLLNDFYAPFVRGVKRWTMFSRYWMGTKMKAKAKVTRDNGVTSYEYMHRVGRKDIPVIVLFYEDFVRNIVVTTERLFQFIKQEMGEEMPTSAFEAVLCAVTHGHDKQQKEKRAHRPNEYNIFQDAKHPIAKQGLVRKACAKWAPFWFEDMWGECMDVRPQVKRITPSGDLQRLSGVNKYCGEDGVDVVVEGIEDDYGGDGGQHQASGVWGR